ncbi:hypothetical protein CEXT_549431 [Caerostris extrusa]|uniref:Uncharacterized protein n=1 Tax=Caerostris extrusa TaxID=172846 RepID=A0AAV4XU56_CAEEX|nr:hypothetical protein CEXT_549431 [Caerostris extrusa]
MEEAKPCQMCYAPQSPRQKEEATYSIICNTCAGANGTFNRPCHLVSFTYRCAPSRRQYLPLHHPTTTSLFFLLPELGGTFWGDNGAETLNRLGARSQQLCLRQGESAWGQEKNLLSWGGRMIWEKVIVFDA